MGWSIGYDSTWNRDIGYGVPAVCDHPDCEEQIDRGLSYVCCEQEPYGGEKGCGLYFCETHKKWSVKNDCFMCFRCARGKKPFPPKPDVQEWIDWKLTDPSWEAWRKENPQWVHQHTTHKESL